MKKILVATTNQKIIDTVQAAAKKYATYFSASFYSDTQDVISFIDFEMPEIKVIDFTCEEIDSNSILQTVHADPWLHYGGIIAIAQTRTEAKEIEDRKDTNILIVQTMNEFNTHFARLLRILWSNQQFLFNRGMQDRIGGEESGSFVCANDPLDINFYSTFLVSYLYSTSRITDEDAYRLQTALKELMANALEHGNCEISYEEKTAWLEKGRDMLDLIAKKNSDPNISGKRIHLTYNITQTMSVFSIRDDGAGFDWRSRMGATIKPGLHGMGIKISEGMVLGLTYNDKGNEVTFGIKNQQNAANVVPGIMTSLSPMAYTDKQVVCRENEPTNDLFFIVSGRFAVYSNRKLVSVLTPNDMFIGEMSFLLDDRRSATVLSVGDSKLILIPKAVFLNMIKQNPHYGVFLSRMIAQRLVKQTQTTLELKEELKRLRGTEEPAKEIKLPDSNQQESTEENSE